MGQNHAGLDHVGKPLEISHVSFGVIITCSYLKVYWHYYHRMKLNAARTTICQNKINCDVMNAVNRVHWEISPEGYGWVYCVHVDGILFAHTRKLQIIGKYALQVSFYKHLKIMLSSLEICRTLNLSNMNYIVRTRWHFVLVITLFFRIVLQAF